MQQVTTYIGSGPFTFNQDQTKQGAALRLRQEPELRAAPGAADRACRRQGRQGRPRHLREHGPDCDRASRRLQAGEIDFFELPPIDLLDQLEGDKNIKVEVLNKTGNVGMDAG